MLSAALVGVRKVRSLCFMSSGMIAIHRTGWVVLVLGMHVFLLVVNGRGGVYQRLQRGAVSLGWCLVSLRSLDEKITNDRAVVDMAAR